MNSDEVRKIALRIAAEWAPDSMIEIAAKQIEADILAACQRERFLAAVEMREKCIEIIMAEKNGHTIDLVSGLLIGDKDGPWFLKGTLAALILTITLPNVEEVE